MSVIYALAHGDWWKLEEGVPAVVAIRIGGLPENCIPMCRPAAGDLLRDAIAERAIVPLDALLDWLYAAPLSDNGGTRIIRFGKARFNVHLVARTIRDALVLASSTSNTVGLYVNKRLGVLSAVCGPGHVAMVMRLSGWNHTDSTPDLRDLMPVLN